MAMAHASLRGAGFVLSSLALALPLTLLGGAAADRLAAGPIALGADPGFWADHLGTAAHGALLALMAMGALGCLVVGLRVRGAARSGPTPAGGWTAMVWGAQALAAATALYLTVLGPGIRPRKPYHLDLELAAIAEGAARARLGELASRQAELGRWDLDAPAVAQALGNRRYRLMPSQTLEDLTLDALVTLGEQPRTFRLDLVARSPKGQAIVYACDQDGNPRLNDVGGFKALLPPRFRKTLVARWWRARYFGG